MVVCQDLAPLGLGKNRTIAATTNCMRLDLKNGEDSQFSPSQFSLSSGQYRFAPNGNGWKA
jgi:hypothetical protein